MKKVLLSNKGAETVENLRDEFGTFQSEKCDIADTMCGLSDMMQFGIDDNDVTPFATDILRAMNVISKYNDLVNDLNYERDIQEPKYGLVQRMETSKEIEEENAT